MKFEEDYTEEDWELIRQRERLKAKDWVRQTESLSPGYNSRKSAKWNEENRERYNEYHRNYMREWIKKHGRPKERHETKAKRAFKKVRYHSRRGRVTKDIYKQIMQQEQTGRILNYLEEMGSNRKKIIMCIVGGSGTGKTLASLHLKNYLNANVVCSYTTRPPRDNEEEGREHHFIDIVPHEEQLLAYTKFGQYKYYATKAQVHGPVTVYVIDEEGLLDLKRRFGKVYDIHSIYIERKKLFRLANGVSKNRIKRDGDRRTLIPDEDYDAIIVNDGTKAEFFEKIENIYNNLLKLAEEEYGWKRKDDDSDDDSI